MNERHTTEFEESQKERERLFEANEQRRESEFNEEQRARETLFKEAQDSREERFSQAMEDLLATARKDEKERETTFVEWELTIQKRFQDMLCQWKREFIATIDQQPNFP